MPNVVHAIGMSIGSPARSSWPYIRLLDRLTDAFVACSSAVADMFARRGVSRAKCTAAYRLRHFSSDDVAKWSRATPVPTASPSTGVSSSVTAGEREHAEVVREEESREDEGEGEGRPTRKPLPSARTSQTRRPPAEARPARRESSAPR